MSIKRFALAWRAVVRNTEERRWWAEMKGDGTNLSSRRILEDFLIEISASLRCRSPAQQRGRRAGAPELEGDIQCIDHSDTSILVLYFGHSQFRFLSIFF